MVMLGSELAAGAFGTGRQRGLLVPSAGTLPAEWERGVTAQSEACPSWTVSSWCDPDSVDYDGPARGLFAAQPVMISTRLECRTRDMRVDEATTRVRAQLDALTSTALARELWTGALSGAAPYELGDGSWTNPQVAAGPPITYRNPRLSDASAFEIPGGPLPPKVAQGELEAQAGARLAGGRVTLHCSPRVVPHLSVDVVGQTLVTKAGSVVIADPGYTGIGPAGTGEWMFATGPVLAAVGPIEVATESSAAYRSSVNVIVVVARRPALAVFDPCPLAGVAVTLT